MSCNQKIIPRILWVLGFCCLIQLAIIGKAQAYEGREMIFPNSSASQKDNPLDNNEGNQVMTFSIKSSAFAQGQTIPKKYTGEGEDVSPPLQWQGAPAGTQSFVLIMEDPDAPNGTYHHWAIYNIPKTAAGLPEAVKESDYPAAMNDFGYRRYGGPMPPKGHGRHRYYFRLGALDVTKLTLPNTASVQDVWKAAKPHLLTETELMGVYERR